MSGFVIERLDEENNTVERAKKDAEWFIKTPVRYDSFRGSLNLSHTYYHDNPRIFLNPTEPVSHIQDLVEPGSRFLTVLGSGFFPIEAGFHGAKEIVTFDIQRLQFFPAALRLASLPYMEQQLHLNFFTNHTSMDYLSRQKYNKFKQEGEIEQPIITFWDYVMEKKTIEQRKATRVVNSKLREALTHAGFDMDDIENGIQTLLSSASAQRARALREMELKFNLDFLGDPVVFSHFRAPVCKVSPDTYLGNERNYEKARKNVKNSNISFLESELSDLPEKLKLYGQDGGFDAAYLSNIVQFVDPQGYVKAIERLMPMLNNRGVLSYYCACITPEMLRMKDEDLRNMFAYYEAIGQDPSLTILTMNAVNAYRELSRSYDLELVPEDPYCSKAGYGDKDTYVYVRK